MSTSIPDPSTGWNTLADSSEEDRRAQMGIQYAALLQMTEDQQQEALAKMVEVEYQLPDDKLRIFTASRLLVWLGMELDQGRAIARSYDEVMKKMPGTWAMKRVGAVQTVTRDFDADQLDKLSELIPSMLREAPRASAVDSGSSSRSAPASAGPRPSKSAWQFWKRK